MRINGQVGADPTEPQPKRCIQNDGNTMTVEQQNTQSFLSHRFPNTNGINYGMLKGSSTLAVCNGVPLD